MLTGRATAQPLPLLFTTGVSGTIPGRRQPPAMPWGAPAGGAPPSAPPQLTEGVGVGPSLHLRGWVIKVTLYCSGQGTDLSTLLALLDVRN